METYRLTIENDTMARLAETLTGRGNLVGMTADGAIIYEVEAEDLWEVAQVVADLKPEVEAVLGTSDDFEFGKPVLHVGEA